MVKFNTTREASVQPFTPPRPVSTLRATAPVDTVEAHSRRRASTNGCVDGLSLPRVGGASFVIPPAASHVPSLTADAQLSAARPPMSAAAIVEALRATASNDVAQRDKLLDDLACTADDAPDAVREALRYRFVKPQHRLEDIAAVSRREMGEAQADRLLRSLQRLAQDMRAEGKSRIVIVNTTFDGGGVAELFQTCAQTWQLLGIDVEWHTTLAASDRFTEVGRKVFDVLQGNNRPISDEDVQVWERENARLGRILQGIAVDKSVAGVFLEDHHPVHLVQHLQERRQAAGIEEPLKIIWRSHVDSASLLARADAAVKLWDRALAPQLARLRKADAALFQPGCVPPDVRALACGVFSQPPGTNLMAEKNTAITFEQMQGILQRVAPDVRCDRAYFMTGGRFVGWKGLLPVMRAQRRLMQDFPDIDHLMFGTVGQGDPRKLAYYALVQAEVRDFARTHPDQAKRMQVVVDQKDDIRAFYAKAKFDRMPVALMSLAEGYNMMADELTYQGALPMTSRQGGLSRFGSDDKIADVSLNIADLVPSLGNPADMYRVEEDGRVVPTNPAVDILEERIAKHLRAWFEQRAKDPAAYAANYDSRAQVARQMALQASTVSMCNAYLGLCRANGDEVAASSAEASVQDAPPARHLVDRVLSREAHE